MTNTNDTTNTTNTNNTNNSKKRSNYIEPTLQEKIEALDDSIAHYKKLDAMEVPDRPSAKDCACCTLATIDDKIVCEAGCPIYRYAEILGEPDPEYYVACHNTPYYTIREFLHWHNYSCTDYIGDTSTIQAIAEANARTLKKAKLGIKQEILFLEDVRDAHMVLREKELSASK